ncbi:carboxypeptidase-like regulatory domain-containing protein [Flavobacterium mesophilum]|uniref:carboxypeptidase-like regulatory domain-containing protein n=1 Tax=Flavobacterium mesophilum TaxID=3143495 RepID=UPI0031D81332
MNLTAIVLDSETKNPIANANVWVNEVSKGKTDANGKFTLLNIKNDDLVNVTYLGYGDAFYLASTFPKTVYMDKSGYALNDVVIKNVFKRTNWFLWLALGAGATAIYAYKKANDSKKAVKAKI